MSVSPEVCRAPTAAIATATPTVFQPFNIVFLLIGIGVVNSPANWAR
jgi:hypothetical protein